MVSPSRCPPWQPERPGPTRREPRRAQRSYTTRRDTIRREFAETIAALQWLATCQMGWYRRGSRYRTDMLDLLGDDFTSQGLPRESGIKMHVAQDGQS